MRRRTVKRTTNDWDSAAYLEEDEDDTQQQRPSRSRRTLGHGNPRSGESGPSTSRRRVPLPSTSTERGSKWTRPQRSFEVSGITGLSPTDDQEDQPLARATQKKRYRATSLEQEDDFCQDDQAFNSRQKKNKRPLNGQSLAKNRRQPSPLQEEDDRNFWKDKTIAPAARSPSCTSSSHQWTTLPSILTFCNTNMIAGYLRPSRVQSMRRRRPDVPQIEV